MKTFEELYKELLNAEAKDQEEEYLLTLDPYDAHQLDCLLFPKQYPLIWHTGDCECAPDNQNCVKVCPFHAINPGETGDIKIDESLCSGCSFCIQECRANKLTNSKDVIPAMQAIRAHKGLVYALVAPAFHGQFSS
jgi:Fe-S-cluster-containing dehydrogenase component